MWLVEAETYGCSGGFELFVRHEALDRRLARMTVKLKPKEL